MNRAGLLAIASLLGGMPWPAPKPLVIDGQEWEDWDLHDEYQKIQRKESRLSRSERDRVVFRFERRQEDLRLAQIRADEEAEQRKKDARELSARMRNHRTLHGRGPFLVVGPNRGEGS